MLKVLSSILCDLDPKVKVIGQKAGICDGVPSTSALVICCTCNMCPRAVEQATQATTRENLSSGFPTKRVSNQSLRPYRLARN